MQSVPPRRSWLPRAGSPAYHLLLVTVALFILGPLGGITAAYMNLSLGFFVGGQVLAGILGSAVTYGYGAEGKHGANYLQTLAASVASLSGMCVLIQAMVWLGMPLPEPWKLVVFFFCVGMFGVGVGMLYTPLLVDRMQLEYPSGHAVANILRALTDPVLLRRSIGKLGGGTVVGAAVGALVERVRWVAATQLSASNIGAGMVIGARNTVPAAVYGAVGVALVPLLRAHGWLGPRDPFRKIGFLAALAMILGAALVDLTMVAIEAASRFRKSDPGKLPESDQLSGALGASGMLPAVAAHHGADPRGGDRLSTTRLLVWCAAWAVALVVVAHLFFAQPLGWMIFAVGLSVIFVYVNGLSDGITDSNPISSAFVVSVLLMSGLGLKNPVVALIASSVLLVSCSVGVDMQQDRSTGWRLGSNRVIQFRYQVLGVAMGAVMCVVLARLFMKAYPALTIDSYAHPEAQVGGWQSAMTFKFVGAIRDLGHLPAYKGVAIAIGLALGFFTELARKLLRRSSRYRRFIARDGRGRTVSWVMDIVVLPSPYASSFGGFVDLATACWFGAGGILNSLVSLAEERRRRSSALGVGGAEGLPEDMSTASLVGGGLIAGEALFALAVGAYGLLRLL